MIERISSFLTSTGNGQRREKKFMLVLWAQRVTFRSILIDDNLYPRGEENAIIFCFNLYYWGNGWFGEESRAGEEFENNMFVFYFYSWKYDEQGMRQCGSRICMHICAAFSNAFKQIFCLWLISSAFSLIVSPRERKLSISFVLKLLRLNWRRLESGFLLHLAKLFLSLFLFSKLLSIATRARNPPENFTPSISTSHFTSRLVIFLFCFYGNYHETHRAALSATTIQGHLVNWRHPSETQAAELKVNG